MQWHDAGDKGRGVMQEGAGECGDRVRWMVKEDMGEQLVLGLGRGGMHLEGLCGRSYPATAHVYQIRHVTPLIKNQGDCG